MAKTKKPVERVVHDVTSAELFDIMLKLLKARVHFTFSNPTYSDTVIQMGTAHLEKAQAAIPELIPTLKGTKFGLTLYFCVTDVPNVRPNLSAMVVPDDIRELVS